MSDSMKHLVEQYLGIQQPVIPSSGNAAEDYDRRNAWYDNARAKILKQPEEAMPYLLAHLEKAETILRRMGLDALHVALPVLANDDDAVQKAIRLGQILSGRVDGLFEAATAYTTPEHPDAVRATAVYLLAQLDHPMREETLTQLLQSSSAAVQKAAQVALGEATTDNIVTKEAAGMTYTFPSEWLPLLDALKDRTTQERLAKFGTDALPALMYAVAVQQYGVHNEVKAILDQMTDDDLPQHLNDYLQPEQPPLVQATALYGLGRFPDSPGLMAHLRRVLTGDVHPMIQQNALEILAEVGSSDDVDMIVPLMESADGRTRTLAGLTLVDLGDLRGAPTVYMQAESDFAGVRLAAISRLPLLDTPEARQHLKRLTQDEDERVRQAAKEARR